MKFNKPTDIGRHSGVLVTSKGQANAFQEPMKARIVITNIGAFVSGKTTVNKNRICPAPSILAESNNSIGIWAKNCRNKKILKTLPIKGIVNAGQLSIQGIGPILPNQVTTRKLGMMVTIAGIIIVLSKRPKTTSRPGNLIRAKAYAARVLKLTLPIRVIAVIFTEVMKYLENKAFS